MFRNDPSCEETTACKMGCSSLSKKRPAIVVEYHEMKTNFELAIETSLILPDRPCASCPSVVLTVTEKTGNFIFVEVRDADIMPQVPLQSIAKSFSIDGNHYKLASVIDFKVPFSTLRGNDNLPQDKTFLGHYTAICLQREENGSNSMIYATRKSQGGNRSCAVQAY
uniref:Uncharacterized protein LOC114345940 n=1 Tax=Diabrotica virgifera virgifera TaxID=50390 RepID=A0A6P7H9G0_DIAVI